MAVGGDLSAPRLVSAYSRGIFPWFEADQPVLWWTPDPRAVLFPNEFHCSRSLRKTLRKNQFSVRCDSAFADVVERCAAPRADSPDTWISPQMKAAYCHLHALGCAHSIETWRGDQLVGGLYGVRIGDVFFGESMFSAQPDTSKIALAGLVWLAQKAGLKLIDCQVTNPHLLGLGAREIPRKRFEKLLQDAIKPSDTRQALSPAVGSGSLEMQLGVTMPAHTEVLV
ncbi:leucyl/phenylalanyl-tRNA--protein transferase [Luminiphilus syltensis NOR5-1B]|uniref:Leucyl/phenylalanyl-tRNA--protein transferase n=1 Tax=Luminiphilus syltensis NOR5-1B TaxID=565045 RepID=B8KRK9_9GAMM|nr:leucyl/phenylalanyl-tRNA--protein transferase [Luminiphilus syltensis]EED36860.1 leucyl/phenylalanyl-tRNA--protein transferase [Luminiphilus syltensis NOR5-1B]